MFRWYTTFMPELPPAITVTAMSDRGLVRSENEDAIWLGDRYVRSGVHVERFSQDRTGGLLLAVADGVGGSAAGEVASRWVTEQIASRLAAAKFPASYEATAGLVRRVADRVNRDLLREAGRHLELRGMATTFTAVLIRPPHTIWMNAGDSRLYTLDGLGMRQITRDHTLREESGDPSIPGNIISNCFGMPDGFHLDVGRFDVSACDSFVLCTDGFTDYADLERAEDVLRSTFDAEQAVRALVDLALEGGGGDNITVLLARPLHE